MAILIGFLTVILVLVCLVMILLVLMQLPKKEAGAGLAFGGAATDALFGAGSGNFLTKATKYVAITFFVLTILISMLQGRYHGDVRAGGDLRRALEQQPGAPAPQTQPQPQSQGPTLPSDTVPQVPMSELPVAPPTQQPAATTPTNAAP